MNARHALPRVAQGANRLRAAPWPRADLVRTVPESGYTGAPARRDGGAR
ncbi:hypothetical protein ACWDCL_19405 [Streptomyces sp. NPDC001009]